MSRQPRHWEFDNSPLLSGEEFAEVCHHLDRRYYQATLGPVRRQWKLRACNALNTSFALGPEYGTYVQIVRPLAAELDDGDLSLFLDALSFNNPVPNVPHDIDAGQDREMMDAEEADEVRRPSSWHFLCERDMFILKTAATAIDTASKAQGTTTNHCGLCHLRDSSSPNISGALPLV